MGDLLDQIHAQTPPPSGDLLDQIHAQTGAPQQRSFADAVANAGEKFWEWTGKPVALALGMGSGTTQERAAQMREAQGQIVKGVLNEPVRVRQELTNALDAFVAGNPRATMHHVLTAVPVVGEGIYQAAQEFNRGDYSSGAGHVGAMVFPAAVHELPAVARAGGELAEGALETGRKATGAAIDFVGGVDPAIREAVGVISPRAKHVLDVAARVKKAREAYTAAKAAAVTPEAAATAAAAETPGMALARESGQDWAKLSAADQAMLETVARANANATAQPAARPPTGPPQAPTEPIITPPPPESGPAAAPAPEPAPVVPPKGGKPAAADLAAQLEASMRAEALTDYLVRNKVPAAMLDEFGPEQWEMVSKQAGVQPPTPENIAAIRDNLAQYDGANAVTTAQNEPAAAAAEFAQKAKVRNQRKPKAEAAPAAPDLEGQLAESLAKVEKGERPVAEVAVEGPAKATASEARVETLAKHLAEDQTLKLADLEDVHNDPGILAQMDKLGRTLKVRGPQSPAEVQQIVDRVRELRGEPAAPLQPTPIAKAKADFAAAKAMAEAAPRKLPSDATFTFKPDPEDAGTWNVKATRGNETIGSMDLIERPHDLEVDLSHLLPKYRGKGYGKAMYLEAIKKAQQLGKRRLISGSEFTEDAARVWRSLGGEEFTDAHGETRWRLPVSK